jgi:hypothetical protein
VCVHLQLLMPDIDIRFRVSLRGIVLALCQENELLLYLSKLISNFLILILSTIRIIHRDWWRSNHLMGLVIRVNKLLWLLRGLLSLLQLSGKLIQSLVVSVLLEAMNSLLVCSYELPAVLALQF